MQGLHHFSPLDEIIPPLYNAFIYGFPCRSAQREKVLSVLEHGWSKTLDEQPMLAGEVEFDQSKGVRPGSLKLRIPEPRPSANIVVNDLTLSDGRWEDSYEDLRAQGMPPSKLDGKVLAPLVSGVGSTSKVVTVQINFIPGGCLLSFCTSHSFIDAAGNALILEMWAKHCRELQDPPKSLISTGSHQPQLEEPRPSLRKGTCNAEYEELKHRPELWHLLGLHATENLTPVPTATNAKEFCHLPAAASPPHGPRTTTCIFSISPSAKKKLKQEATSDGPEWVSSGDALVALLWRSIMRARFPSHPSAAQIGKESIVTVAIDGRKVLSPPLPTLYSGNVVFCCMTRSPMDALLSPKTSLKETALSIRRNVEAAKKQAVLEDAIRLASSIPDVSSLKIAFKDFLGADLITTSWMEMSFYNIEFGPIFGESGRAEFFRMPEGQFGGICSLQPRQMNGIIDVVILLGVEQMKRLRKDTEFAQYFEFVSE